MPKDYKDAPAPRGDSKLSHPLLLGMIIGLLMGIVLSLGVALWLNRLQNPFVERAKPVEPIPKMAPVQPPAPPAAAKAAEDAAKGAPKAGPDKPAAKGSDRPRFEFYQILPGDKDAGSNAAPKSAPAAPAPAPAPAPAAAAPKAGSSPTAPKPHSGETYWLQAGAFTDEKDADNLKAKIAFTGLEATVRPTTTEKGTLYRVRLGPYQSLDDANRIKSALSQSGVGAAIIRATEDTKDSKDSKNP
jgi:cell division protein FtsN